MTTLLDFVKERGVVNIINDYKLQLEITEKKKKCLEELIEHIECITNCDVEYDYTSYGQDNIFECKNKDNCIITRIKENKDGYKINEYSYSYCEGCEYVFDTDDVQCIYGATYCNDCTEDNYDFCYECCLYKNKNNKEYFDQDNNICSDCIKEEHNETH